MRNYIAPGQSIDVAAEAAYVAGQGYVVGSIFGVAANNAAIGETVTLHLTGIYAFDGDGDVRNVAYWDNADKAVAGNSSEGLYAIGTIVGVDGDSVQVRLDGVAVEAVAGAGG